MPASPVEISTLVLIGGKDLQVDAVVDGHRPERADARQGHADVDRRR